MVPRRASSQKVKSCDFNCLFLKKWGLSVWMTIPNDCQLNEKPRVKGADVISGEHSEKPSAKTNQIRNYMGRKPCYQCPRAKAFLEKGERFDDRVHL
jgi:hypothetical protein